MDMNYKLLGAKIKEYRKISRLTQEKLAEIISASPQHISHIESGHTKLSMACFVSICNALKVTPNELLAYSLKTKDTTLANNEVNMLFEDTTPKELFVMLKSASAIKEAMRQDKSNAFHSTTSINAISASSTNKHHNNSTNNYIP